MKALGRFLSIISVVSPLAALLFSGPAFADKRVALVVGNSAYQNVTHLDNPKNDARLMADTLKSLGFILVGNGAQIDLDKAGIDRAVQAFGRQLVGADVGLFYYAGHGLQVRGANYLVPIDANPTKEADVDFQMLDTNLVLRQMESAGTKLNLVILDACRNNPFGGRGLRASDGGLAQMRAPEGTLISFATQPGNVAQDGTEGNSPYTKALAQILRKPGLGIFDTVNEVGLIVKRATGGAQEPWFSSSPIDGSFFFTTAPATVAPLVPTITADDVLWNTIKHSDIAALYEEFLRQFPTSAHVAEARTRLDVIKRSQVAVVAPPPTQPPASPTIAPTRPAAIPPAVSPSAVAAWMAPLLEADRGRIQRIAASRNKALQEAAAGSPEDLRAATELVRAPAQTIDPQKLEGRWRCRSFELGGILPLNVNAFFDCRIRRAGQTLVFEKLTGSIRRFARLDPIDDQTLLFYGSYRASNDPQRSYGAGDDYNNEVGILQALSPDRLRLELPEPRAFNEAHHEVDELVRAR